MPKISAASSRQGMQLYPRKLLLRDFSSGLQMQQPRLDIWRWCATSTITARRRGTCLPVGDRGTVTALLTRVALSLKGNKVLRIRGVTIASELLRVRKRKAFPVAGMKPVVATNGRGEGGGGTKRSSFAICSRLPYFSEGTHTKTISIATYTAILADRPELVCAS